MRPLAAILNACSHPSQYKKVSSGNRSRRLYTTRSSSKVTNYTSKDASFWKEPKNQRQFFERLCEKLQIDSLTSARNLEKLSRSRIIENGGEQILAEHDGSILAALISAFPEQAWRLAIRYPGEKTREVVQQFWLGLVEHVGLPPDLSSLYKITYSQVVGNGGDILLNSVGINKSLPKAIMSAFPEHRWDEFRFGAPQSVVSDLNKRKEYFDYLSKEVYRHENLRGWYSVTNTDLVEKARGKSEDLLASFEFNLPKLLESVYPEHEWLPWMFYAVPDGYWNDTKNIEKYFKWAERQLGISQLEQWYPITKAQVAAVGGAGLIKSKFSDSLSTALSSVYPNHEWMPWKFKNVGSRWWAKLENQRRFLDWCASELHIESGSDWKMVTLTQIYKLGGTSLIKNQYGGSLQRALVAVYPERNWS